MINIVHHYVFQSHILAYQLKGRTVLLKLLVFRKGLRVYDFFKYILFTKTLLVSIFSACFSNIGLIFQCNFIICILGMSRYSVISTLVVLANRDSKTFQSNADVCVAWVPDYLSILSGSGYGYARLMFLIFCQ